MSAPASLLPLLLLLASEPDATSPAAQPAPVAPRTASEAAPSLLPVSAALPEDAQQAALAPRVGLPPVPPTLLPERSWVVPVVEVPLLNAVVSSYDRFIIKADWAQVTLESIGANVRGPWVIDSDDAWTNFLGHPYHGSLAFNAARSSGLTFWESAAFPLVSSLMWELAGEAEPPSINDQVMTSASGVFIGEAFHRTAQLLLDGAGKPGPLEQLLGFALSPLGGVNRAVFGRRVSRHTLAAAPPHEARLLLGATGFGPGALVDATGTTPHAAWAQPYVGVELVYGFPGEAGASLRAPFDHFQLQVGGGAPGAPTGELHLRGLVAGWGLGRGPELRGAWGVFGSHDFGSGPGFRVATTALGVGTALQSNLGGWARLRATGVASGVMLGAAGTFAETAIEDFGPLELAPYSMGPGAQALVDVELSRPGLGALGLTGRAVRLAGITPGRRWESVDLLGVRGLVDVLPGHQVGAEVLLGRRLADASGGTRQEGLLGRLYWAVVLGR